MEFYLEVLFTAIFSVLLAYLLGKLFSSDGDGDDCEQATTAADERGNGSLSSDKVSSAKVRSDRWMKLKEGKGFGTGDRVGVSGVREVRVEEEEEEEAITIQRIASFLFDDGIERGEVGEIDELEVRDMHEVEENEVELERGVDVVGIDQTETGAQRGDNNVVELRDEKMALKEGCEVNESRSDVKEKLVLSMEERDDQTKMGANRGVGFFAGLRDEEIALKEGCAVNESRSDENEQLAISVKEREYDEDVVGSRNGRSENEIDGKKRTALSKGESEIAEDVMGSKSIHEGNQNENDEMEPENGRVSKGSESQNGKGQLVVSKEENEYAEHVTTLIMNEGAKESESGDVTRLVGEETAGSKNETDGKGKSLLSEEEEWEGIEQSDFGKCFREAVAYVDREGGEFALSSVGVSDDEQMQLYGLHKVATEGPCYEPQPMPLKVSARAKWYKYLLLIRIFA